MTEMRTSAIIHAVFIPEVIWYWYAVGEINWHIYARGEAMLLVLKADTTCKKWRYLAQLCFVYFRLSLRHKSNVSVISWLTVICTLRLFGSFDFLRDMYGSKVICAADINLTKRRLKCVLITGHVTCCATKQTYRSSFSHLFQNYHPYKYMLYQFCQPIVKYA